MQGDVGTRWISRSLVLAALCLVIAPRALAFEAFDGRVQLHGFFESQVRSINRNMSEQWDVTQWYMILNLELELDIAPDGVGPLDLIEGYVRVEGRYDCIYSRGCGMFKSVNAYGDRAKSLPDRLSDGEENFATGAVLLTDRPIQPTNIRREGTDFEIPTRNPIVLNLTPGFKALRGSGADAMMYLHTPPLLFDDPFNYVFANYLDYRFTTTHLRGGRGGPLRFGLQGPWLPENEVDTNAALADRVNPFDAASGGPGAVAEGGGVGSFSPVLHAAQYNASIYSQIPNDPGDPASIPFSPTPASEQPDDAQRWLETQARFQASWNSLSPAEQQTVLDNAGIAANDVAGSGALPFRPIPVNSESASAVGADAITARGLYLPSKGNRDLIESGVLDPFPVNFTETQRAFNRGWSQEQTKELKEAYLDIETFDSRLWLRLGKQTIVWGKTELFSATDQYNPSDLALATLPSLEESRIPLWAVRGVWSFYEVGPLEDVRLEVAFNYDEFKGDDFGACGEPYAANIVCSSLVVGGFAHSQFGFGIAGFDSPPSPWESLEGWEIGGRLEWRWDRFSFALSDWWGYDDLPYTPFINQYERNVDPVSGRPRVVGDRSSCVTGLESACLTPGPTDRRQFLTDPVTGTVSANPDYNANLANGPQNALDFHHANQQLFAIICGNTIGFAPSLDPTVCGQSVFNSLAVTPAGPLAQVIGGLLAGGPTTNILVSSITGSTSPLVFLNQDPGDLANPPTSGSTVPCIDQAPGGPGSDCGGPSLGNIGAFFGEDLSSRLTPEQEALIGCGPYWGTNCDDSGFDLLNAEASVVMQSMVGFEGTGAGWTVDNGRQQPGTIGFDGGPVGTRWNGGDGLIILPGARGIGDAGYDPLVDGCVMPLGGANDPCAGASTLYHPYYSPTADPALGIPAVPPGQEQIFQSELAAMSWNLQSFVVAADSAFDPSSTDPTACNFPTPQNCEAMRALIGLMGLERNTVRAGGTERFGRRTFLWHSGGEVVLTYNKRNVLGFALDFAEDRTKTNWGIEFSWLNNVPLADADKFDGIDFTNEYNLTVSLDRQTFINFLNPNRTFFFNTQWFFQYREDHGRGWASEGAWNILATLFIGTGYLQDRLLPGVTFVYDFQSVSGAALPQISYRISEAFSIQIGAAWFMGRTIYTSMPLHGINTASNRFGDHAYEDLAQNGISIVRDRDEVFFRLRYTF